MPAFTHVGHLNYGLYKWLQDYVHVGHVKQKRILQRALSDHEAAMTSAGGELPRVLELGCGGGNFAPAFLADQYFGVDGSSARVVAAGKEHPGYGFAQVDVNTSDLDNLLGEFDFIFCHGFLHHLGDEDCRRLMGRIRSLAKKPTTFVAIEPVLPAIWRNPLGFLICKLDEGRYVRPSAGYRSLFHDAVRWTALTNLMPRWPLTMEAFVVRYVEIGATPACHASSWE